MVKFIRTVFMSKTPVSEVTRRTVGVRFRREHKAQNSDRMKTWHCWTSSVARRPHAAGRRSVAESSDTFPCGRTELGMATSLKMHNTLASKDRGHQQREIIRVRLLNMTDGTSTHERWHQGELVAVVEGPADFCTNVTLFCSLAASTASPVTLGQVPPQARRRTSSRRTSFEHAAGH